MEYPYHLVDYGEDAGVTLEDWRVYTGEIERERSDVNVDSLSLEAESLLTLKCIVQFAYEKGFLLGVRNLYRAMPDGALTDPRWFILRFGESKPWYTESKADFETECRTLGLEAKEFQTFESAWSGK